MAQEKQNAQAKAQKARRLRDSVEWLVKNIFFLCGIVAVASVLFISVYLVISGLPAMLEIGVTDFLFGDTWLPVPAAPFSLAYPWVCSPPCSWPRWPTTAWRQ